jgi:hypothetical protein
VDILEGSGGEKKDLTPVQLAALVPLNALGSVVGEVQQQLPAQDFVILSHQPGTKPGRY